MGGPHSASAPQEDRDARTSSAFSSLSVYFYVAKRRARRVKPRSHRPEPSQHGQADPNAHPKRRIEISKAGARAIMNCCQPFSTESARIGHRARGPMAELDDEALSFMPQPCSRESLIRRLLRPLRQSVKYFGQLRRGVDHYIMTAGHLVYVPFMFARFGHPCIESGVGKF